MVDSSKWEVIEAGLKCLQGKGIVNSISLKEGEEKFRQNARTVLQATAPPSSSWPSTSRGQAATYEDKIRICERAYRILVDEVGFPARGHHLRSEHPHRRHRHGGAQQLRRRLHQRHALDQGQPAARQGQRRRLEHLVQLPRQQQRARGDALGVPLPRHQGRHGHGHRQRRHAGGLRGDRARAERAGRGRAAQPPPRRHRAPGRLRREAQGRESAGGKAAAAKKKAEEWRKRHRRGAPVARAGQGHRHVHRRRHRGSARQARPAALGHRRPADGRHGRRRRSVRRGQDVPPAGREVRARDEEGRRLPDAVHGGGEGRRWPPPGKP